MNYEHGANTKKIARELHIEASSLQDFSANINPHDEPSWLTRVVEEAFSAQFSYPDIEYVELKKAIALYEGIDTQRISLGNGASPFFFDIIHHLPIHEATLFMPTFNEYEQALRANQAKIHEIISFDYEKHLKTLPFQEALFICNPNNPTGHLTPKTAILSYAKRYPQSTIILDESFMDFTDKNQSCMLDIETHPNIIVIKSYTKIFKCPGLRIGALFSANRSLIQDLKEKTPPWSINSYIEAILPHYLGDTHFLKETRELVDEQRIELVKHLEQFDFEVIPSTVNFIMFHADFDVAKACLKQGILIRDCQNFKGVKPYTYRVCVSQRAKNETLIAALNVALKQSND